MDGFPKSSGMVTTDGETSEKVSIIVIGSVTMVFPSPYPAARFMPSLAALPKPFSPFARMNFRNPSLTSLSSMGAPPAFTSPIASDTPLVRAISAINDTDLKRELNIFSEVVSGIVAYRSFRSKSSIFS